MRIVCISDTHVPVKLPEIPDGDILIHAGDLTCNGTFQEIQTAGRQLAELPHRHKIVIAGNHDKLFEKDCGLARAALGDGFYGITYLQDSVKTIEGFRIYGSPWTPRFFDWSFQLEPEDWRPKRADSERPFLLGGPTAARTAAEHWSNLPDGIDILVTHGPPRGILDWARRGKNVGDAALLETVKRIRPRLHVFGHIHSHPGMIEGEGTIFVNAAICDDGYNATRRPIVVEL